MCFSPQQDRLCITFRFDHDFLLAAFGFGLQAVALAFSLPAASASRIERVLKRAPGELTQLVYLRTAAGGEAPAPPRVWALRTLPKNMPISSTT